MPIEKWAIEMLYNSAILLKSKRIIVLCAGNVLVG